ncbi:hypothetical protein XI09_08210 [Bradyrhizobium sp. CCBAU 11386]|nr:hypothetical protein [Bradyrhizobium sp. CCBAU 11386]
MRPAVRTEASSATSATVLAKKPNVSRPLASGFMVPTAVGWLYLAAVMALFSRKIASVGQMRHHTITRRSS